MLDKQRVIALFELFTDLPIGEVAKWEGLCQNAIFQLSSSLKDGINISANMERLCTASAAIAYADYLLLDVSSSSSADEIKIGDVTVKNSAGSSSVKQDSQSIRDYFLAQIEDLLINSPAFITPVAIMYEK